MIELRWLERTETDPDFGPLVGRNVRVLQYRQKFPEVAMMTNTVVYPEPWSDWTDVPVEQEHPAGGGKGP